MSLIVPGLLAFAVAYIVYDLFTLDRRGRNAYQNRDPNKPYPESLDKEEGGGAGDGGGG